MRKSIDARTATLVMMFGAAACYPGLSSLGGAEECEGPCTDAGTGMAGGAHSDSGGVTHDGGTTGGTTGAGGATGGAATGSGTTTGGGATGSGATTTGGGSTGGGSTGGDTTGGGSTGGGATGGGGSGGTAGGGGIADASVTDVSADACRPFSCGGAGSLYCGAMDDGCGNELDCGPCPAGQVCGVRHPNVCGAPCPLCSQIPRCETGTTSVSGTVLTGAMVGPDPVDRAVVWVPNIASGAKLPPFVDGPSCNRCAMRTSDEVVASAVTTHDGTFTLTNVPAGTNIPLVVELGPWRYETTVDVLPCVDNPLPPGVARLPRKQSEGSIPLTAIATGNVDALECVLRKMGIADSEFSNPSGPGRIHLYRNNGASIDATTPNQDALTGGVSGTATWDRYDQVLLPCEGTQTDESSNALGQFYDYTVRGGRVLATHFSYTWLYHTSGFETGKWNVNQPIPPSPLIANVDTGSPQHLDFARWLEVVGALSTLTPPQVSIEEPRRNLDAVLSSGGSERWIYSDMPPMVQLMTVQTPVPPNGRICGRVTYSDFHVANAANSGLMFPAECTSSPLTPQEKILEFMILDLVNCPWPATKGPPPPPPEPAPDN